MAVTVNTARADAAELAATRHLGGVTAAAGPFSSSTVTTQFDGQPFGQLTLAGRGSPAGPVDDIVLNAGHWPDGPGQMVLDGSPGGGGPGLGSTITVTGVPGTPALTVVGFGNSVTGTADGWVTPGEITRLRTPGGPHSAQMLYRFTHAASYGEVRADVAEVSAALPPGAVTMVVCWIAGPAVVAAAIAAPAAVALNTATVRAMAGTAHTGIPASFTQVFPPSRLALLSLAAVAIAVAGALLPAGWAARARPAVALRAE